MKGKNTPAQRHRYSQVKRTDRSKLIVSVDSPYSDSATPEELRRLGMHFRAKEQKPEGSFDDAVANLRSNLERLGPAELMASLAYYRFTRGGQKEQKNRPPWEQTEQFHAEFLQALALTLASGDRGQSSGVALAELAALERKLRVSADLAERERTSSIEEPGETVIARLSRRLAGETRFVRNWAYPAQLQRLLAILCEPLDEAYSKSLGIRLFDLINVIFGAIPQLTTRFIAFAEWQGVAHEVEIAPILTSMFQEKWRGIETPDASLCEAAVRGSVEREKLVDAPLRSLITFSLSNLASLAGTAVAEPALLRVLNEWSLPFGSLLAGDARRFLVTNPVWGKPFVRLAPDRYLIPVPGMLISFGLQMLEAALRLAPDLFNRYQERVKPRFLEKETEKAFRNAFPEARVWSGTTWHEGENDLAVRMGDLLMVVEAKSGHAPPAALRGAERTFHRLLKDLVVGSSEQADKLIDHLVRLQEAGKKLGPADVDVVGFDCFLPLAIPLESLGTVFTDVKQVARELGENPRRPYASTIPLADLQVIFEILETPTQRLHYLWRRRQLERKYRYIGDELDLLATYFDNQFAFRNDLLEKGTLYLYNRSQPIDEWLGRDVHGRPAVRPHRKFTRRIKESISLLEAKSSPASIRLCLALLDIPDDSQRQLERDIQWARRQMKRRRVGFAKFEGLVPLPEGDMVVVGIVHRGLEREDLRKIFRGLPGAIGSERNVGQVLVIGVAYEDDLTPYSLISLGAHFSDQEPASSGARAGMRL